MPASRRDVLTAVQEPFGAIVESIDCPPGDAAPTPSLAVHLANRLMYGPAAGDVARIESIGGDAFIEEQLAPAAINDAACDAVLAGLPNDTFAESWQQLYDRRSLGTWNEVIKPLVQVRHAANARQIHSKRQLLERMVEFWHDHFSINGFDFIVRSLFTKWDATIRTHALGNFRAFLEATATHPCMLYYLDNYVNTSGGPNENYSRELFELHTLGDINYLVPGGYIDEDVYESSRCFTGWTFEQSGTAANRGEFVYRNDQHDRFQKVVLGVSIPRDQSAMKDGRDVLDILANSEGVARFIALKLCRRFVDDNPPESIVASTAAVFHAERAAADQIARTLRHLFASTEFRDARMTKFKRPLDWTISAMRALGMPYASTDPFRWLFDPMGQAMFSWRPPDGPPDTAPHWATTNGIIRRTNFIMQLASGWYDSSGLALPVDGVMPADLRTPLSIADFWIGRVIQRPVSGATTNALVNFMARGRNWSLAMPESEIAGRLKFLAAACVLSPEFQRR